MENKDRSGSSILSFAVGVATGLIGGLVTGFMLANKPGSELRKDIQYGSSEFLRNLRERINDITGKAATKLEEIRDYTDEKFRASAMNIQEQVAVLGRQLDELTHRQSRNESNIKEEVH